MSGRAEQRAQIASADLNSEPAGFDVWERETQAALAVFQAECARAGDESPEQGLIRLWNANIRFWQSFADAGENIGIRGFRDKIRCLVLEDWPQRELDLQELRAIELRFAYRDRLRLNSAGSKDSPMDAAMQFVAATEGNFGESAAEGIRTAIKRFRKSVRGQRLVKLDRSTLMISPVDAEAELLSGLPGRRGRPRTPSD